MALQYQGFSPQTLGSSSPIITSDQPIGWQAANQSLSGAIGGISDYLMKQNQVVQGMQQTLGQSLLSAKLNRLLYPNNPMYGDSTADPKIDAMLSANPYTRQMLTKLNASLGTASQAQQGQPQPNSSMMVSNGNMPSSGMSMNPIQGIQPLGDGGNPSMSGINPIGGNVTTGMTLKGPMGEMTQANLGGVAAKASAEAQAGANVRVPESYATKMADTQALSKENIVRDNTQMMSVFQTLNNLHDIHSQLANSNLAGTHLGEMGMKVMPYVGDIAALTGQKPADLQNKIISPENQALMGQFQSGRNEGITRAVQPMQNQVDKVGSSRISDSMLDLLEGEYGKITDSQSVFDGKTIGTARTLYRITLASQNYADQLKAQGIQLNGSDKNFNPDSIAQKIYDNANSITFNPAQKAQFNQYANKILGTQGWDYSTGNGTPPKGASQNPVTNQIVPQKQNQSNNQNKLPFSRQELLDELNRRKNLRDIASNISQ